jgi:putative hydrolase of the HAD superfamily
MKAILFDVDSTLYDARQYYVGAFQEIASYLERKRRVPRQTGYRLLLRLWETNTSAYPFLFDDLLTALHIDDRTEIKTLVRIFNGHRAKLKAYPRLVAVLRRLRKKGYSLGVITDGNVKRQARKIEALGVKGFFDVIIYTEQFECKPSPRPFRAAARQLKVRPSDALYVGDNPTVDFEGAKTIGMRTVRMSRGEFRRDKGNKYIDWTIRGFDDLLDVAARVRKVGCK